MNFGVAVHCRNVPHHQPDADHVLSRHLEVHRRLCHTNVVVYLHIHLLYKIAVFLHGRHIRPLFVDEACHNPRRHLEAGPARVRRVLLKDAKVCQDPHCRIHVLGPIYIHQLLLVDTELSLGLHHNSHMLRLTQIHLDHQQGQEKA